MVLGSALAGGAPENETIVMSMDEAAILYSPYTWAVRNGTAKTINPGAYFRVVFSGSSCRLHAASGGSPMPSQIWTRVDGGPLQQHVLDADAATVTVLDVALGPPFSASQRHALEVIVKSSTETQDRWEQQSTAVIFSGIEVDAAAPLPALRAPVRRPYNILVYGDSITEGVRTLGYVNIANDTDRNDAVRDYSFELSRLLPAEVGIVAFGATGLTKGGSGNVPALGESWAQLWEGEPRIFEPIPDLVVYNEGTNDGTKNITAPFAEVVRQVQSVAPAARQLLLVPFNGGHAADIQAVVRGAGTTVHFGDTNGFYSGDDGLHPFGYSHVAEIAPRVASLCLPLLAGGECGN